MSLTKTQATYWTFAAIAALIAGIMGYVLGYSNQWQNQPSAQTADYTDQSVGSASIEEGLYTEQIVAALSPEPVEADSPPIHSFTGYIETLADGSISVHHPESDTEWKDTLQFKLTTTTTMAAIEPNPAEATGSYVPHTERDITITDLAVGDIVTVYTAEDILTADTLVATKIQQITTSTNNTN